MSVELNEGILWTAYFGHILLWFVICQIPGFKQRPRLQRVGWYVLGYATFGFILCFYFVLGLSLGFTMTTFAIWHVISRIEGALVARGKGTRILAIISWFQHSALLAALSVASSSPIWLIGATILFVGGIVNVYSELVVKDAIKILDPRIKDRFFLSGFVLSEEFPVVAAGISTSLLYFPMLYFFPRISTVLHGTIEVLYMNNAFPVGLLVAFLAGLFGFVKGVPILKQEGQVEELKSISARVYVGFTIIFIMLVGLSFGGSILKYKGYLDIVGAFPSGLSPYVGDAWSSPPLLLTQAWFAASLALSAYYVLYAVVIMYLFMGARSYRKKTQ